MSPVARWLWTAAAERPGSERAAACLRGAVAGEEDTDQHCGLGRLGHLLLTRDGFRGARPAPGCRGDVHSFVCEQRETIGVVGPVVTLAKVDVGAERDSVGVVAAGDTVGRRVVVNA